MIYEKNFFSRLDKIFILCLHKEANSSSLFSSQYPSDVARDIIKAFGTGMSLHNQKS